MATATVASKTTGTAREYETIYILKGNIDPESAGKVSKRANSLIEDSGGRILKVDNWGRRKLAYPIDGATRGAFVYLRYVAGPSLVRELERNLSLLDEVVRWQTMVLRHDVNTDDYKVSPDDVKYEPLSAELPPEEPGMAQQLGLVEAPRPPAPTSDPEAAPAAEGDAAPAAAAPPAASKPDEPAEADEPAKAEAADGEKA